MQQTLGANYMCANRQERIRYAPGELPDGRIPPFVDYRVNWQTISMHLNTVRQNVKNVASCACLGQPRGTWEVERVVEDLARSVLPKGGFTALMPPGIDPVFVADELLSAIPWEMIDEAFFQCEKNPLHVRVYAEHPASTPLFCEQCGGKMTLVQGKLGIGRLVSHTIRPCDPAVQPQGNRFFLILDPAGDLCSKQNDPEGICDRKIEELVAIGGTQILMQGGLVPPDVLPFEWYLDLLRHIKRRYQAFRQRQLRPVDPIGR